MKLKYAAYVLLLPLLWGCPLLERKPLADKPLVSCVKAPAILVDTCKETVDILNKTNLLVASINDGVNKAAFTDKTMTVEQARKYRARTKTADEQLDHVYDLVIAADFSNASIQASIVKVLVDTLNREVASQIAKGAK